MRLIKKYEHGGVHFDYTETPEQKGERLLRDLELGSRFDSEGKRKKGEAKKLAKDQQMQQQNIQAQSQANIQAQQAAAQMEMQKQQAMVQAEGQMEQMKAQLDAQKQAQEVMYKKELMQLEFQMNMQLKQMEVEATKGKEKQKEDRKDERTRIQASQQSELIDQRKGEKPPKNFESAGNDIMGGGFDLGAFDPR